MLKELIKKIDLKTGIILVLFCISGFFFTMFMLGGSNHRKEIKELQKQNKQLEKEKKQLDVNFNILKKDIERDSLKIVKLNNDLFKVNIQLEDKKTELKSAKTQLQNVIDSYLREKKTIEELEKNPIKRNGNNLLESIKEKTK